MNYLRLNTPFVLLFSLFFVSQAAYAQFDSEDADSDKEEQVFNLSPFEVSSEGDRGYYASNSITGSRISVPIQDIPLTIEVLTSEFIEDTGATDLRDSLKYSAGILLQSQNDAFGKFDNVGNVNNPEGATGDKSESSFKIRGFVLENTLRNGFRRQNATDTINIDRIEVIRGPSALLYGVGNFGGVVNYITKTPLPEFKQEIRFGYGSYDYKRISIDSTGPIFPDKLGYRLTMAYQDNDNWTDLNTREKWFISPALEWRPVDKIKISLDAEFGRADEDAIGFKSVRAPTLEGIPVFQTDRLETYGFLEFPGKDVRTFRWSGPDTYIDTDARNLNGQIEIEIIENLYVRSGINYSEVEFEYLDVFGGISVNPGTVRGKAFANTIEAIQIIDGSSNDVRVPVDNAVFQYNWNGSNELTEWIQHRTELNYKRRAFEGNDWLASEHNFLLGYSVEEQDFEREVSGTTGTSNNWMYKDPTDSSYIRFGQQSDGVPDVPFKLTELQGSVSENIGSYLVYSGRFLDERLFLVAGIREDETTSRDGYNEVIGARAGRTFFEDSTVTQRTHQFGASFEILNGLTIYALQSEGVEPNFGGFRDGTGKALEATVAEAEEVGIKVNLFDGRLAGTISKFRIRRDGFPTNYWWSPAPILGNFRRNEDIVYRMDDFNPELKTENYFLQAGLEHWLAGRETGAVYEQDNLWYLNASEPEGAAFLDAVFAALINYPNLSPEEQAIAGGAWPGWLYNGFDDPIVNTAGEDWAEGNYYVGISDQSEGWEAQLIFTPTDNFQILLNYSHVEREVLSPGDFPKYDYAEGNWDRWAMWYFPNGSWGLANATNEEAYPGGPEGLPNPDTSTWTGVGWGKGEALDDTPEDVVSFWANYSFRNDLLEGLEFGFGGQWESSREYASGFTTAGQRKQNETDTPIKAVTDDRLTLNAMVKYSWQFLDDYNAFIQLNVDNLLNDEEQYGFFYAPGRSWKLNLTVVF